MSKIFKVLVALVAMTALAAPAFAITADFTGFYQVRGFTYDNLDGDDDAVLDDNARGVDQRFRLWTSTALNENVKGVFAIEVDSVWGTKVGSMDLGMDETSVIEVKNIYLDFNIPEIETNVKAGGQYFKLGGGLLMADDAAGLQVRYTPVKGHSLLFAWVKAEEGPVDAATLAPEEGIADDSADSDYYHLQYDWDVAGWRVSPFVAYWDLPGDADPTAWYLGAEAAGKVGPVALAATAIFNSWDDITANDDNTAFALLGKATYAMAPITLTAEAGYFGDDKRGEFVNPRGYINFSEIVTGGAFDFRTEMGGDEQVVDKGVTAYYMNFLFAKLGAEFKATEKDKISAYYVYSKLAEDAASTGTDTTFGHEIDAYYDRAIVPGLTFTVGGGYLIADDEFGAGDDAYKVGTALTYKF